MRQRRRHQTYFICVTIFIYIYIYTTYRYLVVVLYIPILGLIVGAIIRYAGTTTPVTHLAVEPEGDPQYNQSLPPDTLWLKVHIGRCVVYNFLFIFF